MPQDKQRLEAEIEKILMRRLMEQRLVAGYTHEAAAEIADKVIELEQPLELDCDGA